MSQPPPPTFLPLTSEPTSPSAVSTKHSVRSTLSIPRPSSSLSSLLRPKHNTQLPNSQPVHFSSAPPSPITGPTGRDRAHRYRPASVSCRFPLVGNAKAETPGIPSTDVESPSTISTRSSSTLKGSPSNTHATDSSDTLTKSLHLHENASTASFVKETNHVNIDFNPVSGRKQLNTYEVIKEIGRGQHGKVKLAFNSESGDLVAIKIVDRNSKPKLGRKPGTSHENKVRREIAIMKKCCHPNVVQLLEVLDDIKSNKIYLVLEYLEGGEIVWQAGEGVPVMSVDEARTVARDVVSGLEYLHFQGIIHRDIKPANLLRDKNGTVKISDFGVSYASSLNSPDNELELAKTAGTPAFFAPELCVSTNSSAVDIRPPPITHKIDIWAFGVTLYCMLFGKVPFIAESELHLFGVIVNEPLVFPDEPESPSLSVSSDQSPRSFDGPQLELAKDLLQHVLEKDPKKRYDIMDIKQHPWMLQGMSDVGQEMFLTTTRDDQKIVVSHEEVQTAVLSIAGRIKRGLSKIGSHALSLTGLRRSGSSSSSRSSSRDVSTSRARSLSRALSATRAISAHRRKRSEIFASSAASSSNSSIASTILSSSPLTSSHNSTRHPPANMVRPSSSTSIKTDDSLDLPINSRRGSATGSIQSQPDVFLEQTPLELMPPTPISVEDPMAIPVATISQPEIEECAIPIFEPTDATQRLAHEESQYVPIESELTPPHLTGLPPITPEDHPVMSDPTPMFAIDPECNENCEPIPLDFSSFANSMREQGSAASSQSLSSRAPSVSSQGSSSSSDSDNGELTLTVGSGARRAGLMRMGRLSEGQLGRRPAAAPATPATPAVFNKSLSSSAATSQSTTASSSRTSIRGLDMPEAGKLHVATRQRSRSVAIGEVQHDKSSL